MGMDAGLGKGILLTGNLLLAGALFFWLCRRRGKNRPGAGGDGTGGFLAREAGWLLEFSVYGTGMIGVADSVIRGIELPGRGSAALRAAGVLLAESMMLLFPIWKILDGMKENGGEGLTPEDGGSEKSRGPAWEERGYARRGEFILGMLLLLELELGLWREPDIRLALVGELFCLALFAVYEYLGARRKPEKEAAPGGNVRGEGLRQQEYLKNVEQQYQRTRELWHDLKNHIRVLEILAQEERFGELTDYLGSFKRDVEHRMVPVRTGCAAVDALLGDKLYHAGRQGVDMALHLCDLSRIRIREVDLCVILGNLLDNALEACGGLADSGRISLRIRQEEGFCYITMVNTALEPLRQGEGYASGKRGRENGVGHGLGLRSAERTAHRYGGLLATEYKDGEFCVVVRLQAESEK